MWPGSGGNTLKLQDYAIRIEPLPREEGGGFLVTVPDLPGCVADGETIDAAIADARRRQGVGSGGTAGQRHVANTQDLQRPVRPAHPKASTSG